MANQELDKDYLFKTAARIMGEEMHWNNFQMRQFVNILTNVFDGINFVSSSPNMLSTEKCKNTVIIKNFEGCKKMSGIKDSSVKQYILSISSLLNFCNKELILRQTIYAGIYCTMKNLSVKPPPITAVEI